MAFWNRKDGGKSRGHIPPERNPSFPALETAKAWELTHAETAFQATSRSSFRTRAFKNLSKPDAPHEYLEADYLPVEKQWRVRSCIVGEGAALPALFKEHAGSADVSTEVQKSRTILHTGSVMEALQKLSLYEFGTDTSSKFALREVMDEDPGQNHFIDFAHAEGIIFDANGHPSLTQNGKPMRDGEFPAQEINAALDFYTRNQEHKRNPAIIRASELSGIFQPYGRLDGFDDFTKLVKTEMLIKNVIAKVSDIIKGFYSSNYNGESQTIRDWNSYIPSLTLDENIVTGLKEAIELSDGQDAVESALQDALVTHRIYRAAYAVSYYQNKKSEMSTGGADSLKVLLTEVEESLKESGFDDAMKDSVRSYIMHNKTIADFEKELKNWKASVQAIQEAVAAQAKNIIQESQLKKGAAEDPTAHKTIRESIDRQLSR